MRWPRFKTAIRKTVADVDRNHMLYMAAALSYYFILSLFPALIFLSGVVAYIPIPNLFGHILQLIGRFVPGDAMVLIRRVLSDVISPNRGTLLSVGLVGTLWTASGGFVATIEALNIAYEVEETRPFWKTRPLGIGLTFLIGLLLLIALAVMIVGPHFGEWLAGKLHLSWLFAAAWPFLEWSVAVGFTVLAVELLYFLAPNVKQRFWWTLPGATLAVGSWLLLSYGLGIYFRRFAHLNKTYGAVGAVIGLMIFLYWTGFAMLVGGELNAELAKASEAGPIEQHEEPSTITTLDIAS
jgi:membrane protein